MPFLAPVIGIAVSIAVTSIVGSTLIGALASLAVSFIMSALFRPATPQIPQNYGDNASLSYGQQQNVNQSAAPYRVVYGFQKVGGVWATLEVTNNNVSLIGALVLAGHPIHAYQAYWINDESHGQALDQWPFGGYINDGSKFDHQGYLEFRTGEVTQPASNVLLGNITHWTAEHQGKGITYVAMSLLWDNFTGDDMKGQKTWTSGIPTLTFEVYGKNDIYDPRTLGHAYSTNSALIVADYLCDSGIGLGVDYASSMNETALIAAANVCDETVHAASGDVARYMTDGSFTVDRAPVDIMGDLLGAMHGKAIRAGGSWSIYAGTYDIPSVTLTDDDMRSPSSLSTLTSGRDSFNGVKGTYTGIETKWAESDFPSIQSAAFLDDDSNVEQWKDITLPMIIRAEQCQRVAKIDLLRTRQEVVETFHGKFSAIRALTGANVYRDSVRYGWNQKPFEVGAVTLTVDQDEQGNPVIGFDVALTEIDASVFDWTTDEESTIDPAPNTNFPNPVPGVPAGPLTATETLYVTRDANLSFRSQISFDWPKSDDSFVANGGGYIIRYRAIGDTRWTTSPIVYTNHYDALDFGPGHYEAELFNVSWAGIPSSDSLSVVFEVIGLAAPPDSPTNMQVQPVAGGVIARLTLDPSPDLDVYRGGLLHLKHTPALSDATWESSVTLTKPFPGDTTECLVPLKSGGYLAKFQDAGGNWSDDFAVVYQTQQSMFDFTLLDAAVEEPDFAGAKTNCYAADGFLRLSPTSDFDSVADVDSMPTWDFYDTIYTDGTYEFATVINLGAVKHARLTSTIDAIIENVLDLVDSRGGDVDDWPSWDGNVTGNEADVILEYALTQTDPSGSPVWSDWIAFHTVEATFWGAKFRARLVSYDAAYSPAVSALNVVAEEVT